MNHSAKGRIAELYVANYFMERGFYVAFSLDPLCPFDLIVTDKKGKCRLVDVKNLRVRRSKSGVNKIGDRIGAARSKNKKI